MSLIKRFLARFDVFSSSFPSVASSKYQIEMKHFTLISPLIVLSFLTDNYTLDIEEGENYADESLPLPSASTSEGSPRGDMDESNVVTGYRGNSWVFENKLGVAEDLRYLSHMPELCDVTFLVGETREPICAVRAILAARSR